MKKLFYQGSCLIILGMFLLLSSCTKEEVETLTIGGNEIQVDHGMLHFKDFKQFSDLYDYLAADLKRTKMQSLKDFISAEQAFLKTNDENVDNDPEKAVINQEVAYWKNDGSSDKSLTRVILHPIYSSLFNDKALIEIGEQILVLSDQSMLSLPYNDRHRIYKIPRTSILRQC